jgi:hypothetical protein
MGGRACCRPMSGRSSSRVSPGRGGSCPTGGSRVVFLGRQVKISGFRDRRDREHPAARARGPRRRPGRRLPPRRQQTTHRLLHKPTTIEVDLQRERLGAALPHYMVPAAFRWQQSLPLTANSKIDTMKLTPLAADLETVEEGRTHDRPVTPTEQRLAATWATVLGVAADQIGRHDHFFDRGGNSLSAVKLDPSRLPSYCSHSPSPSMRTPAPLCAGSLRRHRDGGRWPTGNKPTDAQRSRPSLTFLTRTKSRVHHCLTSSLRRKEVARCSELFVGNRCAADGHRKTCTDIIPSKA